MQILQEPRRAAVPMLERANREQSKCRVEAAIAGCSLRADMAQRSRASSMRRATFTQFDGTCIEPRIETGSVRHLPAHSLDLRRPRGGDRGRVFSTPIPQSSNHPSVVAWLRVTRMISPMRDIFGSRLRTRVLVLVALMGDSYPTQIAKVLDSRQLPVQRVVNTLELEGVLSSCLIGTVRLVTLSPRKVLGVVDCAERSPSRFGRAEAAVVVCPTNRTPSWCRSAATSWGRRTRTSRPMRISC
jgi:hypothetical protein